MNKENEKYLTSEQVVNLDSAYLRYNKSLVTKMTLQLNKTVLQNLLFTYANPLIKTAMDFDKMREELDSATAECESLSNALSAKQKEINELKSKLEKCECKKSSK